VSSVARAEDVSTFPIISIRNYPRISLDPPMQLSSYGGKAKNVFTALELSQAEVEHLPVSSAHRRAFALPTPRSPRVQGREMPDNPVAKKPSFNPRLVLGPESTSSGLRNPYAVYVGGPVYTGFWSRGDFRSRTVNQSFPVGEDVVDFMFWKSGRGRAQIVLHVDSRYAAAMYGYQPQQVDAFLAMKFPIDRVKK
jgi:hypothetical protein